MPDGFRQWGVALCLSALVHAALLFEGTVQAGKPDGTETREPVRLSFRSVASSTVPASKEVEVPVAAPEKPKPPRPRDPSVEHAPPVEQMPVENATQEADKEPAAVSASVTIDQAADAVAALAQAASLARARQQYEQQLMAHIEARKFYPPIARRRGMEGRVRVSFMVVDAGGVAGLRCTSGPALLSGAACDAVSNSLPLPQPPEGLALPLAVSFGMEFSLKSMR